MNPPRLADTAYRALLRLYPAAFRRRFGPQMQQAFRDRYRAVAVAGWRKRSGFLFGAFADVVRSAALERAAGRQRHDPQYERPSMFWQSLAVDFHHAWRVFTRSPKGTMALAILTLALGIGANTAIFSVIHHALLMPLPYPAADRIAIGWRTNPRLGDVNVSPAITDVDAWRKANSVESITSYSTAGMVVTGGAEPVSVEGVRIEPTLLDFTGTRPLLGRAFNTADSASEGAARVVLLGHAFWTKRFGADPGVLGRRLEVNDQPHEIVGVLPAGFRLPMTDADVLLPLTPPSPPAKGERPQRTSVSALVRLKPGVTLAAAQDELSGLGTANVGVTSGWTAKLMPPGDLSGDTFRRSLLILFGAVACVLLIACANVAHLVLARNAARRREIAVRLALGASAVRLGRQLFLESLLLSVAGSAAGLGLALWGVQAISALRPPQMRQLADIRVSPEVFLFALGLALLTSLVFGLLPAIAAARGVRADALKQGGAAIHGRRGTFARRAITVAEVALALILLTGSGLLLRSYARVLTTDRGFRADGLLSVKVDLPEGRYKGPTARTEFVRQAAEAIAAVPGVTRVVLASGVPPAGGLIFGELEIEGREAAKGSAVFGGGFVEPGFFEALRIPVRDGRTFGAADVKTDVVIINERTAARHWPGQSAVGARLRLGTSGKWSTIVGVVGDVQADHGEAGGTQLYFPLASPAMAPDTTLLVATGGDPSQLVGGIKQRIWALDPRLALDDVETVQQAVAKVTARPRFNVLLLTVFAGIGLSLAMIGVYGVVSYSVGLRTREIGVRMALGAVPGKIARAVVGEALALGAIGVAVGLVGALAASRLMTRLLFEVSPNDPLTLAIVAVTLAATVVIAALVPARRAMRVDPMVALRME